LSTRLYSQDTFTPYCHLSKNAIDSLTIFDSRPTSGSVCGCGYLSVSYGWPTPHHARQVVEDHGRLPAKGGALLQWYSTQACVDVRSMCFSKYVVQPEQQDSLAGRFSLQWLGEPRA